MPIESQVVDGILVARMRGELDHHAVEPMRDELEQRLQDTNYRGLIMSFRAIDFMDSSALGLILGRYRTLSLQGGKMALCEVSPALKRIFELSGLLKILNLFDSEASALEFVTRG
jgi:stage II sporulation protein AA (anti-sigma F factor antagonist)